jgi:hypothetical protein
LSEQEVAKLQLALLNAESSIKTAEEELVGARCAILRLDAASCQPDEDALKVHQRLEGARFPLSILLVFNHGEDPFTGRNQMEGGALGQQSRLDWRCIKMLL